MGEPYRIENLENQGKLKGSVEEPYFFKITSGNRDQKSIICHAQIGTEYFMYRVDSQVHRESVNLRCKIRGCPATASAKIPKSTGLIKENGTRSNGKRQVKKYILDYGNPRLRDLQNWQFLKKNSRPHTPGHANTLLEQISPILKSWSTTPVNFRCTLSHSYRFFHECHRILFLRFFRKYNIRFKNFRCANDSRGKSR